MGGSLILTAKRQHHLPECPDRDITCLNLQFGMCCLNFNAPAKIFRFKVFLSPSYCHILTYPLHKKGPYLPYLQTFFKIRFYILNFCFVHRFFTHKTEMKAPWTSLVRNVLGLVSDHFLICSIRDRNWVIRIQNFKLKIEQ